jgi:hypothetical protein
MKTRNNGVYTIGFYQQLNDQAVEASTIALREQGNPPKGLKKFTNKINERILKKLIYSRKSSSICVCKI